MSYDIYGNYLRPGYCEVHPNRRGSYPCDLCEEEIMYDGRFINRKDFSGEVIIIRAENVFENETQMEKYIDNLLKEKDK